MWLIYVNEIPFNFVVDTEQKEYIIRRCLAWNLQVRAERAEEVKQA